MPYRFAIIGCGHISLRHATVIQQVGKLVAVADTESRRAANMAAASHAAPYADIRRMLDESAPDIVVICSPNGLHPLHAITALKAGCHVLCEKPMAIDVASAVEMVETAVQTGRRLFVVKQNRYNPPVVAVKRLLQAGKLGRVNAFQLNCLWNRNADYYNAASWRGTGELDGGTLYTQFSHFIDLLYWYLGEAGEVAGWRANSQHRHLVSFEDTGVAVLRMKSGALGTLHYTLNAHAHNMEGSITLVGEKGTVKIGGPYLNRLDHFSVEHENVDEWFKADDGSTQGHLAVYRDMINALDDVSAHAVEADEGVKSVEIIEKIYRACPLIL